MLAIHKLLEHENTSKCISIKWYQLGSSWKTILIGERFFVMAMWSNQKISCFLMRTPWHFSVMLVVRIVSVGVRKASCQLFCTSLKWHIWDPANPDFVANILYIFSTRSSTTVLPIECPSTENWFEKNWWNV